MESPWRRQICLGRFQKWASKWTTQNWPQHGPRWHQTAQDKLQIGPRKLPKDLLTGQDVFDNTHSSPQNGCRKMAPLSSWAVLVLLSCTFAQPLLCHSFDFVLPSRCYCYCCFWLCFVSASPLLCFCSAFVLILCCFLRIRRGAQRDYKANVLAWTKFPDQSSGHKS